LFEKLNHFNQTLQTNIQNNRVMIGCCRKCEETFLLREYFYIYDELITKYKWKELEFKIIQLIMSNSSNQYPQVIVFCEKALHLMNKNIISDWQLKGVLIAVHTDDLQKFHVLPESWIVETLFKIDVYIGSYAYRFQHYFESVTKTKNITKLPFLLWIPHSASPHFINQPFNLNPNHKILLAGVTLRYWYPLRTWLLNNLHLFPNLIDVRNHPGYERINPSQSNDFAKEINMHLISYTCTMIRFCLVAKVFEIPAAGSLLLVNEGVSDLLSYLHMINGIHYLGYNASDPKTMISYVLNNENVKQINIIRRNGYNIIRKYHTTSHRAQAIHEYFEFGIETYKIPLKYEVNICPTIMHSSYKQCLDEIALTQYKYGRN
jgi:hypothetical protein